MERRGRGFKKILEDYDFQENSREELMPKIYAAGNDFLLMLYNLNYFERQDVAQDVPQDVLQDGEKGNYAETIIKMIQEDSKVTRAEMAKVLKVSMKTIGREIKKIPQISYIGRGYSGHWEIKDK